MITRHSFTTPIWAEQISVEQKGQTLIVTGTNYTESPVAGVSVEGDLLAQSVPLARWGESRKKKPPHIEFANATTKLKLIEFVKKWGPFEARAEISRRTGHSWSVRAWQSLTRLRRERQAFENAARLIAEIQSESPDPGRVFKYHSQLPACRDLSFGLVDRRGRQAQSSAEKIYKDAQFALCELLNRFPPYVWPTSAGPVELPPMSAVGHGIRHALYCILRFEYLRTGRLGLGVCPHCDEVFGKERCGAVYCSEECSHLHRSLDYYNKYGRDRRRKLSADVQRES
jgi:hypothetical protein